MKLDILAIAAHPDDIEVAAGGALIHHIAQGHKVGLLDLTRAELSTRGNVQMREAEATLSAHIIGAATRAQLGLRDGFFTADEPSLLKVIGAIRKYQPDIIIANALDDRHPDHRKAAELVAQAIFLANLIKIETEDEGALQLPWRTRILLHCIQDRNCKPDLVIDISPYIDQKFEAIRAYKSQFYQPDCTDPETPISCPSFFEALRGRNAMWGRQVGVEYAEAFNVGRPIGVRSFLDLY